jgi:monofunctional biosynthetic peptidoglycan transglycosylase
MATDPVPSSEPPPHRRRGCAGGCWRLLWRGAAVVLVLLVLLAAWQWLTWPDVAALAERPPETTAFVERAKRHGEVRWSWVGYGNVSPHLKRAVLVSEDLGFYDHEGFAAEELEIALREAWEEKELPRGASTITQQVAKNLWLSPSLNPWRKVKEALLTRELEAKLDKRRILEIYLNVVEFGPGVYGAEAAARHYFGKSAAALGEREAAQLAAGLSRPRTWHPGVDSGGYRWKTNLILGRMADAQWLWKVI